MRIETISGLRGELVEYVEKHRDGMGLIESKVIVLRDQPTFLDRPYSTHLLTENGGTFYATLGHYDMSLDEARKDLVSR